MFFYFIIFRGCTGTSITVNDDTTANIKIDGGSQDPVLAFHIGNALCFLQYMNLLRNLIKIEYTGSI